MIRAGAYKWRPRGGKRSRQKGDRLERFVVNALQDAGIAGERIPLSGSAGGSFRGDVSVPVLGYDWRVECKSRAVGFAKLYDWLADNHALVVKADRKPALVVLTLKRATELLARAERYRTGGA